MEESFQLICFRLLENGFGTLTPFALNVVRLPRLQRAGPSAFLDKFASARASAVGMNELVQRWAGLVRATKRFCFFKEKLTVEGGQSFKIWAILFPLIQALTVTFAQHFPCIQFT